MEVTSKRFDMILNLIHAWFWLDLLDQFLITIQDPENTINQSYKTEVLL